MLILEIWNEHFFFLFLFSSIYVLAFTVGKERSFNFTVKNFKLQMINYIQLCSCVTLICFYVRQFVWLSKDLYEYSLYRPFLCAVYLQKLFTTHTHSQTSLIWFLYLLLYILCSMKTFLWLNYFTFKHCLYWICHKFFFYCCAS